MMKPLLAAIAVATMALSVNAQAALGGSPTLPVNGTVKAGQVLKAATSNAYTVRQQTLPNGTTEREYVNTAGVVFGIAWNGPFQPDLRSFMGNDVFTQYAAAVQAAQGTGRRGGAVAVETNGVVAQVGGHQRAFAGRAYVTSLIPAGVNASDIQ